MSGGEGRWPKRSRSTRKDYPPYHALRARGIPRRVARWHRRKGKNARLLDASRAHVETMWAIASTVAGDATAVAGDATALAGDPATAVEVVREVVRRTLPQRRRYRQRGLRLEIVIAATEAAATRAFSPHVRRSRSAAHAAPSNEAAPFEVAPLNAAPLKDGASALRRAFSRRLSWDVQAFLWATEVEGIAESDVERRLGQVHPRKEAARVTLRLAYLDLRTDLDERCRATLRTVFGSLAGPEKLAEDNTHLKSCALCQAETRWLTDLRSSLGTLPSAMPAAVWEEARRFVLGDDSETVTRPGPSPSPEASPGRADVMLLAADSANQAADDASPAANGREHTPVDRGVETQKAGDNVLYR
jgi:hypothetical protein